MKQIATYKAYSLKIISSAICLFFFYFQLLDDCDANKVSITKSIFVCPEFDVSKKITKFAVDKLTGTSLFDLAQSEDHL